MAYSHTCYLQGGGVVVRHEALGLINAERGAVPVCALGVAHQQDAWKQQHRGISKVELLHGTPAARTCAATNMAAVLSLEPVVRPKTAHHGKTSHCGIIQVELE